MQENEHLHLVWVGVVFLVCMWIIWTTDEFDKNLRGELR